MAFHFLQTKAKFLRSACKVPSLSLLASRCTPTPGATSAVHLAYVLSSLALPATLNCLWVMPIHVSGSPTTSGSARCWTRVWTQLKVVQSMNNLRRKYLMTRTKKEERRLIKNFWSEMHMSRSANSCSWHSVHSHLQCSWVLCEVSFLFQRIILCITLLQVEQGVKTCSYPIPG